MITHKTKQKTQIQTKPPRRSMSVTLLKHPQVHLMIEIRKQHGTQVSTITSVTFHLSDSKKQ